MEDFVRRNLRMISESIDVFDMYLKRKMKEQEAMMDDLRDRGLNHRQSQILRDMMRSGESVSQYELSVKYQVFVPTIRRDLLKPIDMGFVRGSDKDGHRLLYVCDEKKRNSS